MVPDPIEPLHAAQQLLTHANVAHHSPKALPCLLPACPASVLFPKIPSFSKSKQQHTASTTACWQTKLHPLSILTCLLACLAWQVSSSLRPASSSQRATCRACQRDCCSPRINVLGAKGCWPHQSSMYSGLFARCLHGKAHVYRSAALQTNVATNPTAASEMAYFGNTAEHSQEWPASLEVIPADSTHTDHFWRQHHAANQVLCSSHVAGDRLTRAPTRPTPGRGNPEPSQHVPSEDCPDSLQQ